MSGYDPRHELLIPVGTALRAPGAMRDKAIGVGDPTKIAEAFGRSYKPQMPLYIPTKDKRTVLMIVGMGQAEAAELEDLALAALDQEERNDWEGSREARGLPQQAQLIDNLRNLGEDTLKDLKRNRRTKGKRYEKTIY